MTKDLFKFIDEKHRVSYVKCISNIAEEMEKITDEVNSDLNSVCACANDNIQIIDDTKKTTEQVLGILETMQETFNSVRVGFLHSYHTWLKEVLSDKCTDIIDLEDPNSEVIIIDDSGTPDIEIVNEIKYREPSKTVHSHDNFAKEKESDSTYAENSKDREYVNLDSQSNSVLNIQNESSISQSFMDISFEAVCGNEEKGDLLGKLQDLLESDSTRNSTNQENLNIQYNGANDLKTLESSTDDEDYIILRGDEIENITDMTLTNLRIKRSDYLDEKLLARCSVTMNGLQDNNLRTSKRSLKEDAFLRLIDLSALERTSKKRQHLSSASSCSSTNSRRSHSFTKAKSKKQKICSDDSDVTSFYESSNSDTDDDDLSYINDGFNNAHFEELDNDEEKAKFMLLEDSDESDSSDIPTDNSEVQNENSKKKTKYSKKASEGKKSCSRSAWLNDEILNFKLPNDQNHEKRNLRDDEISNIVSNIYNNIAKKVTMNNGRRVNSIEITESETITDSIQSISSEEIETHCESHDTEVTITDLQSSTSIGTPNSKIVGRRNIRAVLDDQDITEITREAVKEEEDRVRRLAERREEMKAFSKSGECSNHSSLTLDYDLKTNVPLVSVDKGLLKLLKPHQVEGVKFMWDCCFESVKEATEQKGSGCILAHCMGLGKTLQVITLVHTLLSNKAIGIKTIMIVCPMNTILNWVDEFTMWLEQTINKAKVKIIELTQVKHISNRISKLEDWKRTGGVLIISYDMFRLLTSSDKRFNPGQLKKMSKLLISPGADFVVCDEGHILKSANSKLTSKIHLLESQRRIILTGTPLQNNLDEYHCMVQFVKPHLLGSKTEFRNRFANPIANGQYGNSKASDVKLMKHRAHVLHRLLESCVQRCDYNVLTPLLPPKQEYVISLRLSKKQTQMYQYFIDNVAQISTRQSCMFKNYQEIKRLLAHPKTMQLKAQRPKQSHSKDPWSSTSDQTDNSQSADWWRDFLNEEDLEDMSNSYKLVLLFGLLESCAKKQDKVLVFSQCLCTLDLIEQFLKKFDGSSNHNSELMFNGEWKRNRDYFRLDGKVDSNDRSRMCKIFNDPDNKRARLLLISTRAGGLGINLTGANRVVVFDPSWNPSNDLQSIFRVFRFGQKKPCFIYRFLTAGTMEEKIYIRQVTKLSLSLRVLDEQQIGRHYRDTDLCNLYKLEPLEDEPPILKRPKDDLLAEVFSKYRDHVYKFFEHDSLLENQEEEELNEEERKQAWLEYRQENLAQATNDGTTKRKKASDSSDNTNAWSDTNEETNPSE